MKKPDRFEKIVMVEQAKHHRALFCVEIIGLLRRQHRAYVRMVKRHLSDNKQWQPQTGVGKAIKVSIIGELNVILAAFARYKAGRKP